MRLPAPGRGPHQAAGLAHLGEPQGLRAQVPGGIPGRPFVISPHDRLLRTRRGSRQAVTLALVIQKILTDLIKLDGNVCSVFSPCNNVGKNKEGTNVQI